MSKISIKSIAIAVCAIMAAVFVLSSFTSAKTILAEETTDPETTVTVEETVEETTAVPEETTTVVEETTTEAEETTTAPEETVEETTTQAPEEPEMELADVANGWVKKNGVWYYYVNGTMKTGWQKISGKWYYFNTSGVMQTGWLKVGNNWYYLFGSGAMATGWQKIGTKWYYLNSSGVMMTGWQKVGTKWYYFLSSGAMQTGWLDLNGTWYYLQSSGAMVTGWQKIGTKWYYFNGSGAMQTGWIKVGGKWYYLKSSGAMTTSEWVIGYYWIGADGVWSYKYKGSWRSNSKGVWFGDTSGWYARNTTLVIDGKTYKFDSRGYAVCTDNILNIAYLGIDKQENRSDVMMVISINKTKNTVSCVSILRDSEVTIEGCSVPTKIGYAYKWGEMWDGYYGEGLAMQTINYNFGTSIDKYVTMHFEDVEDIVDYIGGVNINVTSEEVPVLDGLARAQGYTGEGTHEGMNHLCGKQAVAYSRIRSFGGSLAEYYRSHRQHAVIREIFNKLKKMSKTEQLEFIDFAFGYAMETNVNLADLIRLTELKMSSLTLECTTIPDREYETDVWCGWVDTPARQDSDPDLDPKQWLWIYNYDSAGGRLRSYTGD